MSVLKFHTKDVMDVGFCPLNSHIVGSASDDGMIALWDKRSLNAPSLSFKASNDSLNCFAFSPLWEHTIVSGG